MVQPKTLKYVTHKAYEINGKILTNIGKIGVSKDSLMFILPLLLLITLDGSLEHAFCTTAFKSCEVWYASYASE